MIYRISYLFHTMSIMSNIPYKDSQNLIEKILWATIAILGTIFIYNVVSTQLQYVHPKLTQGPDISFY